jgi:glycerol-3-phosphate acyltransferase PlsY
MQFLSQFMASKLILIFLIAPGMLYAAIALMAYLLGSIPFGYVLVRVFLKGDIRKTGSGNIGATNVIRTGNKGLGIATLLLDLGKGYVAVCLAELIAAHCGGNVLHAGALAAAMAALGHVYPLWLGFKGGKAVATGLGVFLALAPLAAWSALGVFILVVLLTRYVSLASIAAAVMFPVFALLLTPAFRDAWSIAGMLFVPLLILIKHGPNIRRLIAGTENRFGRKKSADAEQGNA